MLDRTINQTKIFLIIGFLILTGQKVSHIISGKPLVPVMDSLLGIITVMAICLVSLKIKEAMPNFKFPAFAWATLLALVLSMPFMPTAKVFLNYTGKVDFLATTTPILAFAGISVGNKVDQLKKISWKLVVISAVVFCGTYFGSALIAQTVLKMQGII